MSRKNRQWYSFDLHIHTPASADYQEAGVTMLDILRRAEARGLSAIAFTDHNTVGGYRRMREEIAFLEALEKGGRLTGEERPRLEEYRRLLGKLVVFPGFEFTATLGFHILGIFPPEKSVREIEHILLDLNIPDSQIDQGSSIVGASADVLTAYRKIDEAGGLAIAAHANSTNGVALRGFDFGGQTKIAYTQDPHLHALEVTDLDQRGRHSTSAFFTGVKPEYPRRMHCIQGSDAHRLRADPSNRKNLGVGDRATEMLVSEISFAALRELFAGNDFSRTRTHRVTQQEVEAFDFIQSAREEGPSIVQAFHESMAEKGGRLYDVIADVCAFANTNGGAVFIGVGPDPKTPPVGVPDAAKAVTFLEREIGRKLSPALPVAVDIQETRGKQVIRVMVPRGDDPPYAVEDSKIYTRDEDETGLAVRDEIVTLVGRKMQAPSGPPAAPAPAEAAAPVAAADQGVAAPRTGVEVVSFEERDGDRYYTVRDLRNGNMVKNVTLSSSRRLWHYAISEHAKLPAPETLTWQGDLALLRKRSRRGESSYDLIQRTPKGARFYFGVSEDGIHGEWKKLVGQEEEKAEG
ncbi:MAG: putative DNA binding domain-containing protein [Anaerolineales bacterium]|nr:putative DNA binding domain-containing protein [Anaerolineales bacterium]